MLSREDNELLTRVGADTPMGATMRRYWIPTLRASEGVVARDASWREILAPDVTSREILQTV